MVLKRQRVVLCLDRNCAPFWSMHPPKRAICTPLGFLSKYTPKYKQIRGIPIRVSLLFVSPSGQEGTRRVQCNSPVDCCRRGLDRAEPLSAPLGSRCKRVLLRCIRRSIISYPLWINRGYNLQKHRKEYKVLSNDGLEFPFHLFRICGTLCDQFLNGQQYSVA